MKNSNIFHISAQNIDCGYSLEPPRRGGSNEYPQSRRGGSNEYPQSMFLSRKKKIIYTPVNPGFTIQKWGLRGSKFYRHVFPMLGTQQMLTHLCLASRKRDIGKQWRPRSEATERDLWSGSTQYRNL